jgi:hypothetical protein
MPDLPRQIRAAAGAGFDSVGLDIFSLSRLTETGGRVEDLAELIGSLGLRCPEIAALMIGEEAAETEAQLARFEPAVRVLRPEWILVNSNRPPSPQRPVSSGAPRIGWGDTGPTLPSSFSRSPASIRSGGCPRAIDRAGVSVLVSWSTPGISSSDPTTGPRSRSFLDRIAYVQFD